MNKWRIIGLGLLVFILTGVTACNPLGEGEEVQRQVTVIRSDLNIDVSGSGNIEASEEAKITFGTSGRLAVINVEKGDIVVRGELVAELETDALELAETQAEVALTQKQVALTGAEVALVQAQLAQQTTEYNLENTLDTADALELVLFNARITTRSADHHVGETQDIYTWPDIETAQLDVDNAEAFLEYALDSELPQLTITYAQARLTAAEAILDAKTNAYDTEEVAIAKLQLEAAQMAEDQAQKNVTELAEDIALRELQIKAAQDSVEQAKQSLELANQSVALARQSLTQAQKNLAKATISAPFAGVITAVGAEVGDTVTPALTIANIMDPGSMELIIELDEIDVPAVKIGQDVIISLDALSATEFAGVVSAIFPVPKEVGGVVLYDIEITLNVPEDSGIRIGMSASVDIILDQRSSVLLIPNRALDEDEAGNTIVHVVIDEESQERSVTIGVSDGFDTEILSGLTEGEMVIETRIVK